MTSDRVAEWHVPGLEAISPGVFRTALPLPQDALRAVNVYLIVDNDRIVLVDSGWQTPEARQLLGEALNELGADLHDVSRCLVTHIHRDHYGQALMLQEEFGARISLGEGEQESLEDLMDSSRAPMVSQLAALRSHGADQLAERIGKSLAERPRNEFPWARPDEWLGEEQSVLLTSGRSLDVIETPGHTRGHVVFLDRSDQLLFTGDHILPTITPSIGFEPSVSSDPLGRYLGSLAKVRALPDAKLLPAHGPVQGSTHARVDELLDHHGRRLDETEGAVLGGAATAFEVARHLRWTRRLRQLGELDDFNQMLAVAETVAHLVVLVAQRRVVESLDERDRVRYLAPAPVDSERHPRAPQV